MEMLRPAPPVERLKPTDVQALFERYAADHDPRVRDILVERFLPLSRHLANRYFTSVEIDDLHQVAALALVKAIDRYDPTRGIAFTTFAVPTIAGELKRYFRDYGWSVRAPRWLQELSARVDGAVEALSGELGRTPTPAEVAERCDESVEHVLEALSSASAHRADSLDRPAGTEEGSDPYGSLIGSSDDGFERAEQAADIDALLSRLPEREQAILRLRFHDDLVQRDIAARMNLSQMQVSRLIRDSLATMRAQAETA